MKKFFITLIILLLMGGTVFFFGWIQIRIDHNQYIVMFSKTSGYESEVMEPGVFNWKWELLIPTNTTLFVFDLSPRSSRVTTSGKLPSSDVYNAYIESNTPFNYDIDFIVSYRIKPDRLPPLVEYNELTPETLEDWYVDTETLMVQKATLFLMEALDYPEEIQFSKLENELKNFIRGEFPQLDIYNLHPETFILPDLSLYTRAKSLFMELMEAKQAAQIEIIQRSIDIQAEDKSYLDTLTGYGQVLTEYPVLIDVLKLQEETGVDILNLLPE